MARDWRSSPLTDEQLARMAAELSDTEITQRVRDAFTGEPVDRYVYRLVCGHLYVLHSRPAVELLDVYCPECQKRQGILTVLFAGV